MNKTALVEFQDALIVRRIVAKVAMEHSSPEELKKYLHDHPGADPSNHHVKKDEKGDKGKGKGKEEGGGVDHSFAEAEGKKSQARFDDNKKAIGDMESLKKKVDNADPSAKKKFDKTYDKLLESGEKAAGAAKKLLSKYEKAAEGMKGNAKEQTEAALELLGNHLSQWEGNKLDHHKNSREFADKKLNQAKNTYGYAQELEALVKDFHKILKDPDHEIDQSWRH